MVEAAAVLDEVEALGTMTTARPAAAKALFFWRQASLYVSAVFRPMSRGGSDLVPVVVAFLGLVRAEPKSPTRRARRRTF